MNATDAVTFLDFSRRKTLELLDSIAAMPEPRAVLAWRAAPGRANIAWQLMHLAATDDRHLNVRIKGGQPQDADLIRRYAGGSTPDDDVPSVETIRARLNETRAAIRAHLVALTPEQLTQKPQPDAPWTYGEWFALLSWHEGHHQGQAHATLNLYKSAHGQAGK
jgi:uncharacterized damage-inducible protein DinB